MYDAKKSEANDDWDGTGYDEWYGFKLGPHVNQFPALNRRIEKNSSSIPTESETSER